jgi:hypothetical protein
LFRAERRPNTDLDYPRAEAARILLTAATRLEVRPQTEAALPRRTI